jgi:hypothetical protein
LKQYLYYQATVAEENDMPNVNHFRKIQDSAEQGAAIA